MVSADDAVTDTAILVHVDDDNVRVNVGVIRMLSCANVVHVVPSVDHCAAMVARAPGENPLRLVVVEPMALMVSDETDVPPYKSR